MRLMMLTLPKKHFALFRYKWLSRLQSMVFLYWFPMHTLSFTYKYYRNFVLCWENYILYCLVYIVSGETVWNYIYVIFTKVWLVVCMCTYQDYRMGKRDGVYILILTLVYVISGMFFHPLIALMVSECCYLTLSFSLMHEESLAMVAGLQKRKKYIEKKISD